MLMNCRFHLRAVDILATRNDHVFGSINDEDVALLVPNGNVTRPHPAIAQGFFCQIRPSPVAEHIGFRADDDFSVSAAIFRCWPTLGVDNANLRNEALPSTGAQPFGVVSRDSALVVLL